MTELPAFNGNVETCEDVWNLLTAYENSLYQRLLLVNTGIPHKVLWSQVCGAFRDDNGTCPMIECLGGIQVGSFGLKPTRDVAEAVSLGLLWPRDETQVAQAVMEYEMATLKSPSNTPVILQSGQEFMTVAHAQSRPCGDMELTLLLRGRTGDGPVYFAKKHIDCIWKGGGKEVTNWSECQDHLVTVRLKDGTTFSARLEVPYGTLIGCHINPNTLRFARRNVAVTFDYLWNVVKKSVTKRRLEELIEEGVRNKRLCCFLDNGTLTIARLA